MGTFDRIAKVTLAAGIVGLPTSSCGNDRPISPTTGGPPFYSAAGIPSTEAEMRGRLDRITRAVAVALHNPDVRAYVYQQLHASPYPEHKLHFAPFVSQAGSPLSA